jgi:crotonobetainyl-CoA:carnitine CoA-transferase CaiB-like acyl-CoA transferase
MTGPLADLSVVEISDLDSVAYAGMVLGQLGARVSRLAAAAQASAGGAAPPVSAAAPASAAEEFFNGSKQIVLLDHSDQESLAAVRSVVTAADVVVADQLTLAALGLELPPRRSGQLRVFVGPYGGDPAVAAPSSALTRLHSGTTGYLVPADADTSARPAWPGPYLFESVHGVGIALAVVAEAARPEGGDVDYSLQAYGVWLDKLLFSRTSARGVTFHRNTAVYPYGGNLECADGYVAMFIIEERQWQGLCRMIGKPEWLDDERFANGVLRSANREPIAEALNAWCRARPVATVLEATGAADVPAGLVRRPSEVLEAPTLLDRDFFLTRNIGGRSVRSPGLPFGPGLRAEY